MIITRVNLVTWKIEKGAIAPFVNPANLSTPIYWLSPVFNTNNYFIFLSAVPLCAAIWFDLSLLISYCGLSTEA